MIKVLDSFVADKIAAGEVIERPVSAVKELVENSIDAGASSIIVEIRGGGKSYIRVTDDGCGIAADEAETAFLRHATSKISGIADLDAIASLGFRGEALASIAAVSRITMVSRTADSPTGIRLVMHGGQVVSSERAGANTGTTIVVEDLFYNTPARRKFMKSDAREASAIIELIQQFAVYYADIRFMMINNGRTVFTTRGDGDVRATVEALYPDIKGSGLISVEGEAVRGYVSDPGTTRSTRRYQLFFVNGRIVDSSVIEKGLTEGYGGRIFSGYPIAILFIDSDPHDIDVNIHPGKREIRFLRQDEVRSGISEAVSKAVSTDAGIPEGYIRETEVPAVTEQKPVETEETTETITNPAETSDYSPEVDSADGDKSFPEKTEQSTIREFLSKLERPEDKEDKKTDTEYEYTAPQQTQVKEEKPVYRPFDFSELTFKAYVFDTYIIMEGRDTLYIFDQHAAHERIFYEKFMAAYNNEEHIPQPILTPFTLNVSADVYFMERAWLDDLHRMGYDIEDFGECTFIVRGVPPYMSLEEADGFVRAYAEALYDAGGSNDVVRDKLIMRSCKSAVKANDRLSELEIRELIGKLASCENPYACPHGRPTFIKLSSYDIERSFRRK